MKKLTTFLALMLFPVSAMLLAVEVKNGVFEAEINPCGAVLTKLSVQGKQWCTCIEKQSCFDDQLGQNQGEDTQLIEYTKQLDYALREMTFDNLGTKVAFSLRSLAYPGLRLEKTYTFSKTKPEITLQWELRNTGTKPLDVSLNTRAFLLRENTVNNYLHPTKDSFKEFASDEKSFFTQAPERPFLAVRDDKNDGAVIILPETETRRSFSACSTSFRQAKAIHSKSRLSSLRMLRDAWRACPYARPLCRVCYPCRWSD